MGRKKNMGLTTKDREALRFIVEYINENHYAPTVREMQDGLGVSSTSTIKVRLNSLKNKGFITFKQNQPRTIVICDAKYKLDLAKLKKKTDF